MAKIKFTYNEKTCRYEPFYIKGKALRNKVLRFLLFSFLLASAAYYYSVHHFELMDERLLHEKNQRLKLEWTILQERIDNAQQQLAELIKKDDHNYRVILDINPLDSAIREAGIGGSEKFNLSSLHSYPAIVKNYLAVDKLKHQLDVEVQSYDELEKILDTKIIAWAARPAIQPLSNQNLTQLHTTYGARFHKILGFVRDHKGLDFSADIGTPIYATGDGIVKTVYFSGSYGNVIFLEHDADYETRYAHLSKFNVKVGQQVRRGDVIGFVGNTGLSVGPHLHYEVLYKGEHVNPINFFQRDLSNAEYLKLIHEGDMHLQPLD